MSVYFDGSFYDKPLHYSIISVRYYKGDIYHLKTSLQVTVLTSLREKNPRAERLLRELLKRSAPSLAPQSPSAPLRLWRSQNIFLNYTIL